MPVTFSVDLVVVTVENQRVVDYLYVHKVPGGYLSQVISANTNNNRNKKNKKEQKKYSETSEYSRLMRRRRSHDTHTYKEII